MEGMFFADFIREAGEVEEVLFSANVEGSLEAEFSFREEETPVISFDNSIYD